MTALYEIQKAIVQKLKNDTVLMDLITEVTESVKKKKMPYIFVGEPIESPFNTFDRKGKDVTFTLHIWSDKDTFAEGYRTLDRVNELLDYQPLNVSGFDVVYCRYEGANPMVISEGYLRQIPVNYNVVVQEG